MAKGAARPTKVVIGPHTWQIVWDLGELTNQGRAINDDCFGLTEISRFRILMDDSRPLSGMQETLLHEVLHAIIWFAAIDIPENKEDDANDREEKLVGQLSGQLLMVFKHNPKLASWLLS